MEDWLDFAILWQRILNRKKKEEKNIRGLCKNTAPCSCRRLPGGGPCGMRDRHHHVLVGDSHRHVPRLLGGQQCLRHPRPLHRPRVDLRWVRRRSRTDWRHHQRPHYYRRRCRFPPGLVWFSTSCVHPNNSSSPILCTGTRLLWKPRRPGFLPWGKSNFIYCDPTRHELIWAPPTLPDTTWSILTSAQLTWPDPTYLTCNPTQPKPDLTGPKPTHPDPTKPHLTNPNWSLLLRTLPGWCPLPCPSLLEC